MYSVQQNNARSCIDLERQRNKQRSENETRALADVDSPRLWHRRLDSDKRLMRKGSNQQNCGFIVGCYESVGLNTEHTKVSSQSLTPPDSF